MPGKDLGNEHYQDVFGAVWDKSKDKDIGIIHDYILENPNFDNPDFVHQLFEKIADFQIAKVKKALEFDFDAVYFGDDWGQQHGLIMGPNIWREFIKPYITKMYKVVKNANKKVFIHSCGDVDELFDDLIDIGLDCFNPFQPEAMDTFSLMKKYKGRLSFQGGMSIKQTLPFGTPEEIEVEARKKLLGKTINIFFVHLIMFKQMFL